MNTPAIEPKRAILEAADRLFLRHGYRRTTIEDIAHEAGIGKGTVYLHFKSKEEIGNTWMAEWHERVFADLVARTELEESYEDKVRTLLLRRVLARYCSLERWEMSVSEVLESLYPLILANRGRFERREAEYLATILREGVAKGVFCIPDADIAAASMLVATNSLLPYNRRPKEIGERDQVELAAQHLIDLLLRALRP